MIRWMLKLLFDDHCYHGVLIVVSEREGLGPGTRIVCHIALLGGGPMERGEEQIHRCLASILSCDHRILQDTTMIL